MAHCKGIGQPKMKTDSLRDKFSQMSFLGKLPAKNSLMKKRAFQNFLSC